MGRLLDRARRRSHGTPTGKRRRTQRGVAAVEFALVAPVLFVLLFGIIDFGVLMSKKSTIADAAFEGARTGAISHSEAAIDSAVTSSLGDIPAKAVTITVGCTGPAPGYTVCPPGGFNSNVASGGTVVVTLKYHYNWVTPIPAFIGMGGGVDVTKTVEMRVE
jgi:Flp pilus assembly protein TadG